MSISGTYSPSLNAAVAQVYAMGIVVIVAAGNDGQDACKYSPGSSGASMTVAALTDSDSLLQVPPSNWGTCINMYAPGYAIRSTYLNGSTVLMR